jgi:hypothetical protein
MTEATSEAEWPAHFPHGCPPEGATGTGGDIYRFVRHDPPAPDDMRSWLELGLGKGRDCQRAALSCSITLEHLEEVRRAAPLRRTDRIARATLGAEHGKVAQTGSAAHYSLWFWRRFHAEAHRFFEVVA